MPATTSAPMDKVFVVTYGSLMYGAGNGDYTRPVAFPTVELAHAEAIRFMKGHFGGKDQWVLCEPEMRGNKHVVKAWINQREEVVWLERLEMEES